MIAVAAKSQERAVAEEFFQLFKTPWEFYGGGPQHYEVLIVTDREIPESDAALVVVYGAEATSIDALAQRGTLTQDRDLHVQSDSLRLPIYGKLRTFPVHEQTVLLWSQSSAPAAYETCQGKQRILRVGYDLFQEISFLLSTGQPPGNALIPTLDLHIALLRHFIVSTGIPLVEIPPVPAGYRFIACLTHDVDFMGIARHFLDHSMWGFLYRATLGCLRDVMSGKATFAKFKCNLKAALSLPFVFLGLSKDPWDQFDHCLQLEQGFRSTFFFVPFKKRAGTGFDNGPAGLRATRYDVEDAAELIRKLEAKGCEIGVHGIDSWHSVETGREELLRIKHNTSGEDGIGIRIHWLCHNEETPEVLDEIGYAYDSTVGYNDAVGFKAGTSQIYRPVGVNSLVELPLHIQDTALFSHGRMRASESHAHSLCGQIMEHAATSGGAVTVLWHERSLGPERLWDKFYAELIAQLEQRKAWFATAKEAVAWFRLRRSVSFERHPSGEGEIQVTLPASGHENLPPLLLRRFNQNGQTVTGHVDAIPSDKPYAEALLPSNQSLTF